MFVRYLSKHRYEIKRQIVIARFKIEFKAFDLNMSVLSSRLRVFDSGSKCESYLQLRVFDSGSECELYLQHVMIQTGHFCTINSLLAYYPHDSTAYLRRGKIKQ